MTGTAQGMSERGCLYLALLNLFLSFSAASFNLSELEEYAFSPFAKQTKQQVQGYV